MMTDAQAALIYLQGLTVECEDCDEFGHTRYTNIKCDTCRGISTVPKYPALWAYIAVPYAIDLEDISLNDLLIDAAKWHTHFEIDVPFRGDDVEVKTWSVCINSTGADIEAATPIEAALVALARVEGQPEKEQANGNI